MNLKSTISNYKYYFKEQRNPIVWLWGVDLETGQEAAKAIYSGNKEWFATDTKVFDALIAKKGEEMPGNKPMGVDIMLINTDAAPIRFLIPFLEKSKVYTVKTNVPSDIKAIFRAKELILVDEIDCGKGVEQQTWVRSGKRRP